ncbi:VOC family protein [Pedobacter immunditicola]|uniref:VOC family protein n=1 Tax=Pedobacter immunditicola TaxID=3133440 RepID=UPI0030A04E62
MRARQMWFNLPVKDIQKAKVFYKEIGFTPNPMHENADHMASFFIGEKQVVMMLFPEDTFKHFTGHEVSDTSKGTEVLLNIDADSREEVDEMCQIVRNAGGKIYTEPMEAQGWMYAFGFEDPDGHRWAMLHMDMTKMP